MPPAKPAPMPPTRCMSKASLPASPTGWASWRMSSGRKAMTWACGCLSAKRSPSSPRPIFPPMRWQACPSRAVAMARLAPEDKFAGLAPKDRLATALPALDLEDAAEPSADLLIERARSVEGAALAVTGVTNSEGGGASFSRSAVALATSTGFYGRYAGTSHGIGVAVLAGEGTGMERDYDHASARHAARPAQPRRDRQACAGEKAVKRLNPRSHEVAKRAGGVSSRRSGRVAGPFRRRDFRPGHRPRRLLPQGPHGRSGVRARHQHHRRSPSRARPAFQAVRRRRRRQRAAAP